MNIFFRELQAGDRAWICRMNEADAGGSSLHRLGFRPGIEVEVISTGQPWLVRVGRASVAAHVEWLSGIEVVTLPARNRIPKLLSPQDADSIDTTPLLARWVRQLGKTLRRTAQ